MIYPITDRLLPTINNAEFKRYAMRYLDIERQTQQAITQYGLSFEPAFSQQSEINQLKQDIKALGACFANMRIMERVYIVIGYRVLVCSAAQGKGVTPHFYH
ncbi:hypothetical protein RYX27_09090 [Providencia hangzhouensis]